MDSNTKPTQQATFGAGCFWGIESAFRDVPGVLDARVGYEGGTTSNPTYQDVCTGRTGHAEVVQIDFDPARVNYDALLEVFWKIHDPTTLNRQGPDVGSQYRSAIFTHSDEQQAAAEASKRKLADAKRFNRPIVTEIVASTAFYAAEDYHQQYFAKRGIDASCHL